ncbi:hypothetical protein RZQ40_23475 [Enterobacter roggenkampii]|uniref:hypothetical protein n=1 Tax=Enterobacter roggenkampii TaxID=1812935 RepID=UPI00292C0283|nr:hypothetical protein [Enterobacter roggenkampii]MDV0471325.1 hypothetical protein [Enterobacter roggenkampii]MDV1259204.1 hypothetical protein [Enterobacter roggenkampii]MDV1329909.1 hypothetical protein [Enterobacter roggenkampii]MDV1359636.1 hypothetical protein [Enterobacter roggenkampii]
MALYTSLGALVEHPGPCRKIIWFEKATTVGTRQLHAEGHEIELKAGIIAVEHPAEVIGVVEDVPAPMASISDQRRDVPQRVLIAEIYRSLFSCLNAEAVAVRVTGEPIPFIERDRRQRTPHERRALVLGGGFGLGGSDLRYSGDSSARIIIMIRQFYILKIDIES